MFNTLSVYLYRSHDFTLFLSFTASFIGHLWTAPLGWERWCSGALSSSRQVTAAPPPRPEQSPTEGRGWGGLCSGGWDKVLARPRCSLWLSLFPAA